MMHKLDYQTCLILVEEGLEDMHNSNATTPLITSIRCFDATLDCLA
jgi:hypothetical protein